MQMICINYGLIVETKCWGVAAVVSSHSRAKLAMLLFVTCSRVIWLAATFLLVQNADGVYIHTTFSVPTSITLTMASIPCVPAHVSYMRQKACRRQLTPGKGPYHQV